MQRKILQMQRSQTSKIEEEKEEDEDEDYYEPTQKPELTKEASSAIN